MNGKLSIATPFSLSLPRYLYLIQPVICQGGLFENDYEKRVSVCFIAPFYNMKLYLNLSIEGLWFPMLKGFVKICTW